MSDDTSYGCWTSSRVSLHSVLLFVLMGVIALSNHTVAQSPNTRCLDEVAPNSSLSLGRAAEIALCNNADIKSASASVRVRAAQLGEAHSEYWPSLTASSTGLRESTRYPSSPIPTSTDTATTVYGAMTWRILDFGGRDADSRGASALLKSALGARDATTQKVLAAIIEEYFDSVTSKALLQSKAEDEALASQTLESAEHRLQRGDGAQSDVLQAKTALARATLDANRAEGSFQKSLAVLAYSVGLPTGMPFTVPDETDDPVAFVDKSLAEWLEDASQRHPAIMAARADIDAAEAQVVSARSSGRPTVDFQANYYANGFPEQGLATTRQRNATVGIAITIPLFDGFMSRYKVLEAEATVNLKQAALIDTERVTLSDIVKVYSDANTAISDLRESRALLDVAQASQVSSQRRYDAGATNITELLTAQTALADARQERVRCLADWQSARLRLLATSGVLSTTELSSP